MKIGDKKTLTIAPEDGYGAQGVKNPQTGEQVIPGNATLIFDVELVDIKRQ
jgi:FKBP-type peptidyl-prolyl cis-trans isomerase